MAALSGVMHADFSQFRIEVDKSALKLLEFQRAGVSTSNAMTDMADGLSSADRILSTVGVNLSRPIGALRELGNVSGVTFEKLGLFGSLGLAASVGVATYELTKMGAEFIGLDTAIGNATATLLGWGDVAAANATAQTDALALATQRAGYAVTTVTEAIRVNTEWNQKNAAAINTGAQRLADWDRQISKVRNSGDLETITRELKEGSSTVKQLAERFGISAEAITHYTNRTKESTAILEKWRANEQAGIEKMRLAQEELNQAGDGWRNTLTTIAPATAAAVTQYLAMDASQTALATKYKLTTFQVQALDKALQEQTATLARNEPAIGTLSQFMAGLAPEIRKAGENMMFFDQQLMASIATVEQEAVPAIEKLEETFRSVTVAAREMAAPSKNAPGSVGVSTEGISFPMGAESALKSYTARFGTSSAAGMIGGGIPPDFLTWAMSMGLAQKALTITNTFNVVDTESEIARRVSEEISRQIQRGSLVQ